MSKEPEDTKTEFETFEIELSQKKDKEWRSDNWLNPVQMKDFDDVGVC